MTAPEEPFIRLRNVRKVYRSQGKEFLAVSDVTMDVQEGELVSLVGPSGCGKTTVLKILAGLHGADGGSVINLSTISSVNPVPNSVIYSASKSAVDTITRALANELVGRKIRVNAIAPGMTATEGLAALGIEGETAKTMGAALPMGRLGEPDDIARVALFLASDQSAWLTGERITASGGQR